ncbi:MAG TPA: P-loop NTPase fold protein [Pyrinomonadaceae bacterium]|jgi:uncharacterized protein YegP (UPF0339 family)|nr:P-loop NTPase fold protein [Pyrinomonadaceae bacterium]
MTYNCYKDYKGEWRWRLKTPSGRIIADSGGAYLSKQDCLNDINLIKGPEDQIVVDDAASSENPEPAEQPKEDPKAEEESTSREDRSDFGPRNESVPTWTISDQCTKNDTLGFAPYVRAIADFLTNERTIPPLTLSIEGEWGVGKSSFMLQLKDLLEERDNLTLEFNAWRHDKHEELWAAFALEFIRQISSKQWFWRRWWANFSLRRRRFDWTAGWLDLTRAGATWLALLSVVIGLPLLLALKGGDWIVRLNESIGDKSLVGNTLSWVLGLGGSFVTIVALISISLKLRAYIGNPLTIDLKKHLKSPNYGDRASYIESFHRDLKQIVVSYVGKKRVFVFIDDLDRCEVPKAAELMQAINLMIADDPQLVFVIGMDRDKIAAGIAVKHEKLLRYLAPSSRLDPEASATDSNPGLTYGYRFIEKFIQVPFLVPVPTIHDFRKFLERLTRRADESTLPRKSSLRKLLAWRSTRASRLAKVSFSLEQSAFSSSAGTQEQATRRQQVLKLIDGDIEGGTIRDIVLMAASLLGHNPRRLKQFINLFRLRAHIASETGLFDLVEGTTAGRPLTLQQLGKFIAITQVYPRILADLETDDQLLTKLQFRSEGQPLPDLLSESAELRRWQNEGPLARFLGFGIKDHRGLGKRRYSLSELSIDSLLKISPRVNRKRATAASIDPREIAEAPLGLSRETFRALDYLTEVSFRQLDIDRIARPRLTVFLLERSLSPERLVQVARFSWAATNNPGRVSMTVHQGVAGLAFRKNRRMQIDRFASELASGWGFTEEEASRFDPSVSSIVCVPISGRNQEVVGVLSLDVVVPKVLDDRHVEVLERVLPSFAKILEDSPE